jgi:hypothetical protein
MEVPVKGFKERRVLPTTRIVLVRGSVAPAVSRPEKPRLRKPVPRPRPGGAGGGGSNDPEVNR